MKWSRLKNSNIATAHLAFSTQAFGDTSVIIVNDFFPSSTTLRDRHSPSALRSTNRILSPQIPEQLLWSYMVQIANALKAIHASGSAARSMEAKRWLVTDEDRIRFTGCGLVDILDPTSEALQELQHQDLQGLGKLIFFLGTTSAHNKVRLTDHFKRVYTPRLNNAVEWLQQRSVTPDRTGTVEDFLKIIATDAIDAFDASLRLDDVQQYYLNKEQENSRLLRLQFKLNAINNRSEYETDASWREQGQREALKLFRDYVFHQVDASGNPVLDMGHMLACLNKLDVGIEEKMMLTSRSEQTVIVVSYKEIKTAVESAWGELMRRSSS